MNRRTRRTLPVVAAVLVLLAVAIFLRSKAPPEAARLLPEADGIIYVNLKPIRVLLRHDLHGGTSLKPPTHAPEYQQFIDATGIDWERDLDQVAIALHRMDNPLGPNGPVAYSMVLVGKLTGPKLNQWMETHASTRESYDGHTIYSIPSEGRIVRIAQIGYDTVAVSNFPTPEKIHSILDRHRTAALPFSNSSLLAAHYHDVPLLSLAWGIGQIGLPFSESGVIHIFGFNLQLHDDTTIIASLSPGLPLNDLIHLQVEEIAPTQAIASAQRVVLQQLLDLSRIITDPLPESLANRGFKNLLKSAEITQNRDRVIIKAAVPASALNSLTTNAVQAPFSH